MEQELISMLEWFCGVGACTLMFFFTFVICGIIIYVVCYCLWILHIFATIRRRFHEDVWQTEADIEFEERYNE